MVGGTLWQARTMAELPKDAARNDQPSRTQPGIAMLVSQARCPACTSPRPLITHRVSLDPIKLKILNLFEHSSCMNKRGSQVLTDITHGTHIAADKSQSAVELAAKREDITLLKDAVAGSAAAETTGAAAEPEEVVFKTPFDYLFPGLTTDPTAHLPADNPAKIAAVVAGLKALGDAMVEDSLAPGEGPLQPTGNSTIPPVYTYWGQFIDHDLTANTDRDAGAQRHYQARLDTARPGLRRGEPEEPAAADAEPRQRLRRRADV